MTRFSLDRDDTIIMVIDIQERLAPVIDELEEVIKNTKIMIKGGDKLNIPIIITEQYPEGLGKTVKELEGLIEDKEVYSKISFSAYTNDIKKRIDRLNKNKVIIVGMETHICVYQTARDLIDSGYEVYLLEDGVSSRTKKNKKNGLEMIRDMGGIISNTEMVLFDLLKEAGTEEFKYISKLIK